MKRALLATTIASLAAIGSLVGTSGHAKAAVDASNGCSPSLTNPHVSNGAQGIIAKAYWKCSEVPTTIHLSTYSGTTFGFYLYDCQSSSPEHSESWLNANCSLDGINHSDLLVSTANQNSAARYSPPSTDLGAEGSGYWISLADWVSTGPGGTGSREYSFSNTVQISFFRDR
jgi:hypothetical protein